MVRGKYSQLLRTHENDSCNQRPYCIEAVRFIDTCDAVHQMCIVEIATLRDGSIRGKNGGAAHAIPRD